MFDKPTSGGYLGRGLKGINSFYVNLNCALRIVCSELRISFGDLVECPWRVVHPRHHRADVVHTMRTLIKIDDLLVDMLCHVILEALMHMSVQVRSAIACVVFEERNRVVAQDKPAIVYIDFHVFVNLCKLSLKSTVIAAVMIAFHEEFCTI